MGAGEASTDEKTAKNSEKQRKSFFLHFSKFCHHGFQNGLATSIFDDIQPIIAHFEARTVMISVV